MTGVFELLAKFLEYTTAWLPRPILVPRFEALVVWTLRGAPRLRQGLVWIVPLVHHTERVDTRSNAVEFEPKILWTKDGREAAVGMVVLWRVADVLKCCEAVDGLADLVSRVGESVLPELVGRFTLEDLKRKAAGGEGKEWGFDTHLRTALAAVFDDYGIAVDRARLNFTSDRVRTLKLIGSGTTAPFNVTAS